MRYLGQLGAAVQAVSRAHARGKAPMRRPDGELHEQPGITAERAAAWRAWAEFETTDVERTGGRQASPLAVTIARLTGRRPERIDSWE